MKRRNFFKKLGMAIGIAAIAPKLFAQEEEELTWADIKAMDEEPYSVYFTVDTHGLITEGGAYIVENEDREKIRNGGWYVEADGNRIVYAGTKNDITLQDLYDYENKT